MAESITIQELIDARTDAKTLEEAVNGDAVTTVLSRLGETYPTLSNALNQIDSKLDSADAQIKQGITNLFENGGLPATPFATKALMTASALADGKYAMVTEDVNNNGLYVKTAGAWVKSAYDTAALAQTYTDNRVKEAIDDKVSELFVTSYNLFNPATAKENMLVSEKDGQDTPETGWYASDYIKVRPNSKYSLTAKSGVEAFRNFALYRADKSFIKRMVLSTHTWNTPYVLNTDNETYFIRVSTRAGTAFDYERMVYKGDDIKPYMPYFIPHPKSVAPIDSLKTDVELVAESVASSLDSRFFLSSSNLFNYKDIKYGYVIDGTTGEVKQVEGDPKGWCCTTEFVSIEPDSYLTYFSPVSSANIRYSVWYDKDKKFITRGGTITENLEDGLYKKVPENAYYVRFALQLEDFDGSDPKKAVYAGKIPIDDLYYISGKPILSNISIGDDVLEQIHADLSISANSSIILSSPANGVYSSTPTWDSYTGWKSKRAKEVYAMYDALATQHPSYIKRVELGEDDFGNAMYYYEFFPVTPSTAVPTTKPAYDKHKLNLVCGIHGDEKLPTLATYLMLEQICNNWQSDPMLEVLRFNLDMVVLPVANPSGWNVNGRKNGNGVDLNRNFPQGFYDNYAYNDPASTKYGGGEPLNQKEAQYIATMLNEHKNAQIAIDFHNHFRNANNAFIWASVASGEQTTQAAKALITRMHSKWVKEFDWINKDEAWLSGYITTGAGEAVLQGFMRDNGAEYAMTLEVCDPWLDAPSVNRFDATMCKTATETITNMILVLLNELDKK